ncbi:MAG TPA: polymer-forming cytoskeletal protein [Candidatus Binatia bacterium]|jgi:cytoskeletal protein CcmA (bactofilin family)
MAWFDRSSGGKKGSESEPVKSTEAVKPVPASLSTASVPEPKPIPKVEVAPPSGGGLVGYLHKGSRVSGQLSFQGPARVDGVVDGDIQCKDALTIGESAEIRAKISGQVVVIRGRVEGNVIGKEKVELLAPARLIGDITTPRLIIAEGVVFDGDCSMGAAAERVGGVAGAKSVSADRAAAAPSAKLQAESKS